MEAISEANDEGELARLVELAGSITAAEMVEEPINDGVENKEPDLRVSSILSQGIKIVCF